MFSPYFCRQSVRKTPLILHEEESLNDTDQKNSHPSLFLYAFAYYTFSTPIYRRMHYFAIIYFFDLDISFLVSILGAY
jgi:hypothetical protein